MLLPLCGIIMVVCSLSISIVNGYVILPYAYSGQVGWATQLVMKVGVRKRYIATSLLQMLKPHPFFHDIMALGMVSSHPAACHALCKYTGNLTCQMWASAAHDMNEFFSLII